MTKYNHIFEIDTKIQIAILYDDVPKQYFKQYDDETNACDAYARNQLFHALHKMPNIVDVFFDDVIVVEMSRVENDGG